MVLGAIYNSRRNSLEPVWSFCSSF